MHSHTDGYTLSAGFEWVTPAIAAEWLLLNIGNRKERPNYIRRIASDITAGRYTPGVDAIGFTVDGFLRNGQHRLQAVVMANKAVLMLVVRGLPLESVVSMDSGAVRQQRDVLGYAGYTNASKLSAALSYAWKYDNDFVFKPITPTRDQALSWINANEELVESINLGEAVGKRVRGAYSILAATHYLTKRDGGVNAAADSDEFMRRLETGLDMVEGDGVFLLRRWFENKASTRKKEQTPIQFAYCLKAMNQWRAGELKKNLVWHQGGAAAESMPRVLVID